MEESCRTILSPDQELPHAEERLVQHEVVDHPSDMAKRRGPEQTHSDMLPGRPGQTPWGCPMMCMTCWRRTTTVLSFAIPYPLDGGV